VSRAIVCSGGTFPIVGWQTGDAKSWGGRWRFGAYALPLAALALIIPAPASASTTFTQIAGPTIPDNSDAIPSTVAVSGLTGTVSKVRAAIFGIAHDTDNEDIDVLLAGPGGQATFLVSDACANGSFGGQSFLLDDAASAPIPLTGCASGIYKPTNADLADDAFAPATGAPAPTAPASLAVFNGTNPNGTWKLYSTDDTGGGAGSISAWSVEIETKSPPGPTGQRAAALKKCKKKKAKARKKCKKRARTLPV
jgi:hypothetical protein